MSKALSTEAIDALRQLNEVGSGQPAPQLSSSVAAELLSAGVVTRSADHVEITCDGRKYLSGDCD
ncbi:MAG: hypothetical protein EPN73_13510 [Paraburkholderia sp.]|uniref:Uncharacterized protein n=1 Tax=Paraburkholderia sartisoli TaxID=83784 RepID=A0A1H4EAJ9_9BURK|nr:MULTISPECIES: hypothetical protein [Paraburkholderia]TAL95302.1 MAG: hypothetical protein EPN73_13510 [Paraburkholderia sp.]SEA82073.1 hypothetical protein SAMN05192564_103231 [Paraburkholderia sartisoli]